MIAVIISRNHVDCGITLGSAQRIPVELVEAGYVQRAPMLRTTAQDGYDIGAQLNLLRLEGRD